MMLDPVSAINYTNDVAGRLIALTDPIVRTTKLGYDLDGRRKGKVQAAVRQRMDVGELTPDQERLARAVSIFEPEGPGAGHRDRARPLADTRKREQGVGELRDHPSRRPLVELGVGVGRRRRRTRPPPRGQGEGHGPEAEFPGW